jgi:hypothetical protein
MADFPGLLEALSGHEVEYILIGGVAARIHGSARLVTTLGDIDILGEVVGGGSYEQLLPNSSEYDILGPRCRCVDLPKLIELKRAAGRPRDLDALAELEAILEERERQL